MTAPGPERGGRPPTLGFSFARSYLFSDRFSTCGAGEARSCQVRLPWAWTARGAFARGCPQAGGGGWTGCHCHGIKDTGARRAAWPCLGPWRRPKPRPDRGQRTPCGCARGRGSARGLRSGCYRTHGSRDARFLKRSLCPERQAPHPVCDPARPTQRAGEAPDGGPAAQAPSFPGGGDSAWSPPL